MRISPGKSRLLTSLFSFSGIQAAQLALPLLALPWLARVLGPDDFGLLMFFCLIPPLCSLFMDWGLLLGVARAAACLRGDSAGLGRLFGAMLGAKIILALSCMLLALLFWPILPNTRLYPEAYALAVAAGILRGLSPICFLQGLAQGLRKMAMIEAGMALGVLGLALLLIHRPAQWPLYLLFLALIRALGYGGYLGILALAFRARASLAQGFCLLKETRQLFGASLAASLGAYGSQIVLGYFLSASEMGIFVAANKMYRALAYAIHPLSQVIFPELCAGRKNVQSLLRKSLAANFLLMFLMALIAWICAPWLIALALGANYASAVPVLRVLLLAAPFLGLNVALSEQVYVVNNQEKRLAQILALAASANICLAALLTWLFGLSGAAWQAVLTESAISLALLGCARNAALRF